MSLRSRLGHLPPLGGGRGAPDRTSIDPVEGRIVEHDTFDRSGDLPFLRTETAAGALYQRLLVQRSSAAVGRIPVEAARSARSDLLALLGLSPALATVDPRRALFLDTETTGLGGAGTVAFLIGLAWFDDAGALVLEQLLLTEPSEEAALLERVSELVRGASLLVTFNGKSFDLPLLRSRYVMNGRAAPAEPAHFDLLHVARRIHRPRLSRFDLRTLESEVLGYERSPDDIHGADIAPRFAHFLRTGDAECLRPVVDHNAWDVLTMAALVGLYGEPEPALGPEDLAGYAGAVARGGDHELASSTVERALEAGGGAVARRMSARLAKARGDRIRALGDYEILAREVSEPGVRLELAKLYEHHAKDYERALRLLEEGTGEDEGALGRRRDRLLGKQRRAPRP